MKKSENTDIEEWIKRLDDLTHKSKKHNENIISDTDTDGESENSLFNTLEKETSDSVNESIKRIKKIDSLEEKTLLKSLEIKNKLLKIIQGSVNYIIPVVLANLVLLFIMGIIIQIRLYWTSFGLSNTRIFEIVLDIYKNTKMSSLAPIALLVLFVLGWLFKKASANKNDDNLEKSIIDKLIK